MQLTCLRTQTFCSGSTFTRGLTSPDADSTLYYVKMNQKDVKKVKNKLNFELIFIIRVHRYAGIEEHAFW